MAGIQSEQAQQFGKGLPAVRHHKVLAGDQQVQTGRVVPGPRAFSGVLAVNADVKAQRAGLNGFGHGQDRLAQLLSQISGLLPAPVQPAQDQRENGFQSQQGEDFCQHRVRHLRQVKTVALERAHEVFGIHLIRNGAQLRQEGVKLLRPVFPCQAEDPLQLVAVNRTVVLNLPGQQVAGDVEQRAQGRKCGQPVPAANKGLPGTGQNEAQLIPGDRSGAEGLAENDMPVQLPDGGLRIGDQLKISVAGGGRFQPVIEEAFGQGVD